MIARFIVWLVGPALLAALLRLLIIGGLAGLSMLGLCAATNTTGAIAGGWFILATFFPAAVAAGCRLGQLRTWWRRLDVRVADMLWATMLATWLTLIGLMLNAHHAGGAPEEVFTGWVASVIFWGFVGLIVAVVSLARPENEGYQARARILFRNQEGQHIDYIIGALCGTIGHYAQRITRDISIREYHPDPAGGPGWFLLEMESETTLKAYVEDAETQYESKAEITIVTGPPPGVTSKARILRAECTHPDHTRTRPIIVERPNGFDIEYTTRFNGPGHCVWALHRQYWVREGEENVFELSRFACEVVSRIRNDCANCDPVWMARQVPSVSGRIPLQRDENWNTVATRLNGKPDEVIYDFRLYAANA